MGRIIVVGDVHGCAAELRGLLRDLRLRPTDQVHFVGDLVDRGPHTVEVLSIVRKLLADYPGSSVVAGNHELNALRLQEKFMIREQWMTRISDSDWRWLDSLPLFVRLPGALVVHAGVYPSYFQRFGPLPASSPHYFRKDPSPKGEAMRQFAWVRHIYANGHPVRGHAGLTKHWSEDYNGREGYIVYGHDVSLLPREAEHAVGIDTGCCFGGGLTALVVENADFRSGVLAMYPALARYAETKWAVDL